MWGKLRVKYLIKSTHHSLLNNGLAGTFRQIRGYIGAAYFPVGSDEVARRFRLGQALSKSFDSTVAYGPFTGLQLSDTSWWGAADRGSMLLGIYEKEVLDSVADFAQTSNTFIDIGAADGYYAVGAVASGLFEMAICFEISQEGQAAISKNAKRNGVSSKVHILGEATPDLLVEVREKYSVDLSRTVFLIDIEGAEFGLVTAQFLREVSHSVLIIEIHDWEARNAFEVEELASRAAQIFKVSWLTTGSRDMSIFQELSEWPDDDRWILCSESRRKLMRWLVLSPKEA